MNIYPVEISLINVNDITNDIQNMEGIEYIDVDKENNGSLISTYIH